MADTVAKKFIVEADWNTSATDAEGTGKGHKARDDCEMDLG